MAISRNQLVKELEPGLNALFGLEYKQYENQTAEIYTTESSDRAFEEEVMLSGFAQASVKPEGSGVVTIKLKKLLQQDTLTRQLLSLLLSLKKLLRTTCMTDLLQDTQKL
jgi:hypothetical protein